MVVGGDGYQLLEARLPQKLVVHQLVHHLGLSIMFFIQQEIQEEEGGKQNEAREISKIIRKESNASKEKQAKKANQTNQRKRREQRKQNKT